MARHLHTPPGAPINWRRGDEMSRGLREKSLIVPINRVHSNQVRVVRFSKLAEKQTEKLPRTILRKLDAWIESVEHDGLETTRRIPGYHDEPLKGKRLGQRSIRLNRSYRVIYEIKNDDTIEFVSIEEVSKHDY